MPPRGILRGARTTGGKVSGSGYLDTHIIYQSVENGCKGVWEESSIEHSQVFSTFSLLFCHNISSNIYIIILLFLLPGSCSWKSSEPVAINCFHREFRVQIFSWIQLWKIKKKSWGFIHRKLINIIHTCSQKSVCWLQDCRFTWKIFERLERILSHGIFIGLIFLLWNIQKMCSNFFKNTLFFFHKQV